MPGNNTLWSQSANNIVSLLHHGDICIEDTLSSLEERIATADSAINALPTLCFDRARERAARMEKIAPDDRGPLAGLPVSIKDLTTVSGVRTTFGSKIHEHFVPQHSDRLVEQIERRGGIVYAKSNTPEFGTGGITFNDVFGITRCPRNLEFASGGSSGGAAASLASGCAWLSHGSDVAGSLRTPAAFCGVTSLRPSPGRIRSDSEYLPNSVLGAEGPMARDIADLGLFTDALFSDPLPSCLDAARQPQNPKRIAVSGDLGIAHISDDVLSVFNRFIDRLAGEGIEVVEAAPDLSSVHDTFDVLRAHEYAISHEQTLHENPDVMKEEVEWNIQSGLDLSAEKIRAATRDQGQIINAATAFMSDYDLLLCPASSVSAVPATTRYPGHPGGVPIPEYYRWLAIAYATTVTTLPIITLPCGVADNGMPVGVQLIGRLWREQELFRHASALELLNEWDPTPVDPE